jgi:pyruvate,water dikinase
MTRKRVLSTLIPPELRTAIVAAQKELDKRLRKRNLRNQTPFYVARSSAVAEDSLRASFAGQYETCFALQNSGDVIKAVRKCWASLFRLGAIEYQKRLRVSSVSMAVVVQEMIPASKAGVMFTEDPIRGTGVTLIEACWGLGDTLVRGSISPDAYRVANGGATIESVIGTKHIMKILDQRKAKVVTKQTPKSKRNARVLSDDEIRTYWQLSRAIVRDFQVPQDIEFCKDEEQPYILQTRPITSASE